MTTGHYRHAQTLSRGLQVLTALNRLGSGTADAGSLARTTGLHRTTVKRLLETLVQDGYLKHEVSTGQYRLTLKVQALSAGFRDPVWIVESAWPTLRRLSRDVVWPCTLSTLEGEEMVVRISTHSYSPLSFHPGVPGRRLPLMRTAAGRAYLAFAPSHEQQILLDMLRARAQDNGLKYDSRDVSATLQATRKQGFGVNRGEWEDRRKFGGIALPIFLRQRIIACANIVFLTSAVGTREAETALAERLRQAVAEIEARFAEEHDPRPL